MQGLTEEEVQAAAKAAAADAAQASEMLNRDSGGGDAQERCFLPAAVSAADLTYLHPCSICAVARQLCPASSGAMRLRTP